MMHQRTKRKAGRAPVSMNLEHASAATRLIEKRREIDEMQEALDSQKDEFLNKEDMFYRREENLRKKDLELQEALVLFNKFLRENEAKRRRADQYAVEEMRVREEKEREIALKQKKLETLRAQSRHVKKLLSKNNKYREYVLAVQEANSTDYPDLELVLSRFDDLKEAHKDLVQRQIEVTRKHEAMRQEFHMYSKEAHNAQLQWNNDIARLSRKLEIAVRERTKVEEKVESDLKAGRERTYKLSKLLMAVDNLHHRCCSLSLLKHLKHGKSVEQLHGIVLLPSYKDVSTVAEQRKQCELKLDVVGDYVVDFAQIVREYG